MHTATTRIRRLARPMALLATLALVAIPLGLFAALLGGFFDETRLRDHFGHVTLPETIGTLGWGVSYGVGVVSVGLGLLALWHMRTLFILYAHGEILGKDAALAIRRIGLTLLGLAVFSVLGHTLIILALTADNPPGHRSLSVGISTNEVFLFFASGLLVAIGWAMVEATRIADENRSFV